MRIAVFVDGSNFFFMQRDHLKWSVDAKKLLEYCAQEGVVVDAYYYVGKNTSPESNQDGYLKTLSYFGYSIITKALKTVIQEDGTLSRKANLDVEIVLDMFNTIDNYDRAILVSGDGDFERPLQLLRARGKTFTVMSTDSMIAQELRNVAGMHVVDFQAIRQQVEKR